MPDSDRAPIQECVEGYLFTGRPPRFLVLRRPPDRGRIWVPVSGKVEPSDASFVAAIERELLEETGVRPPSPPFPLDWRVEFDGPDGRRWRLHGFGIELPTAASPRLSDEHDAFEWVDAETAIARLHYEDNREAVKIVLRTLGHRPVPIGPGGAG